MIFLSYDVVFTLVFFVASHEIANLTYKGAYNNHNKCGKTIIAKKKKKNEKTKNKTEKTHTHTTQTIFHKEKKLRDKNRK